MRKIVLLSLVFILGKVYSQDKHLVEITNTQTDKAIIVKAKNKSKTQQEVTLTINQKNLKGYKKPITKLVPANSEIEIVKLYYIKGKKWSYNANYTYKEKPTDEEIALREKKLKEKINEDIGDINKGIVVFSKDGCPRCNFTTKYLLDNNIDFKYLNTSENKKYSVLMWSVLKEKLPGISLKTVTMPVILVNGELSYNLQDLKKFVKTLKN